MSQNSLTLPTTGTVSGLAMTQATNNALDTLNTLASGASAPASPEAGQFWHDTTNNILKLRSLDNTSWISLLSLSETSYLSTPFTSAITSGGNRLVNSGMVIDQVNEGAAYTIPTSNTWTYTADQWQIICQSGSASGITGQQVNDAPAGFSKSLKLTMGTGAGSVASTDNLQIGQPIEGYNVADLAFGSSSAFPISLSFWVKSSITGTFTVLLGNASGARTYVTTFNVPAAGVWQKLTLANIPGDQSGSWPTGNSQSLGVSIVLGAGSGTTTTTLNAWQSGAFIGANTQTNSILTTSGATFQFTGVMLNAGTFCLPFEKRGIQQELATCERYFEKSFPQGIAVAQNVGSFAGAISFQNQAASTFGAVVCFRVPKRTIPTLTTYNPQAANANWRDATNSVDRVASGANIGDKIAAIQGVSGAINSANEIHYSVSARM